MTVALPVQEFQIGQRVSSIGKKPFIIQLIYYPHNGQLVYAAGTGLTFFTASCLTLAPERLPYEPSERRTLTRRETDDEMAARHELERAEYDAQGKGE